MVNRHKYKNIDWIDLESPKEEDILPLVAEFSLHPLVVDELQRPSERARVDPYGKYMYMIFHFPGYKRGNDKDASLEIDFILGKNFIITSHYEPIDLFLEASKALETKSILDKFENETNSEVVFHHIMRALYQHLGRELDHIKKDLAAVEKEIFIGHEDKMVHVLSRLNKAMIDFRHPLKLHLGILESLEAKEEKLFGASHEHYTEMIIGEYKKIWGQLENNRELLADLRDTNDSLFSAKTNNIMKNLTIMSFLTFPLTLMTGIFSMNTASTPLAGLENGFWIILGIMATATILIVTLFKYKRWI